MGITGYEIESAITNTAHDSSIKYFDFGVNSKLLDERLRSEVSGNEKVADTIEKYKELKTKKKPFNTTFEKISTNGDLSSVINGVTIILPNRTPEGGFLFNPSDRNDRAERLGLSYSVKVETIDEENNLVTLSTFRLDNRSLVIDKIDSVLRSNRDKAEKATLAAKERVDAYMQQHASKFEKMSKSNASRFRLTHTNEEILKGYELAGIKLITVPARVTKVEEKFLICDIMGFNIPAKLFRNDWSFYTYGPLSAYAHPGDVIDVCIKGVNNNKAAGSKSADNKALYTVTRLPLFKNPWENLSVKKDDDIKVTCVDRKDTCWFGKVEGLELEVYGEYNSERGIKIILGEQYLCHVYKCDAEMRTIKVRPFEQIKKKSE